MNAVAYAWHSLATLRFVRVVAVSAVALSIAGAAVLSLALAAVPGAGLRPDGMLVTLLRTNMVVPIAAAALAVAAVGSDVGRGTVLPALLRARGRDRAWLARLAAACSVAALLALVCVAGTVGVVTAVAGPVSVDVVAATAAGVVTLALGWACVGVGFGSVVRHQFGAIALPVVLAYIVEPIVRTSAAFGPEQLRAVSAYLPFSSGVELVRGNAATARTIIESTGGWHASAAVFVVFALAVAGVGLVVFRRADLIPTDVA